MTVDDLLAKLPASAFTPKMTGRFQPKLTPAERCAALACFMSGINRRVIAVAFGIDRRTVAHIVNSASPHYRDTRQEASRLGKEEFVRTYLTEEIVKRIGEAALQPEVKKSDDQLKAEPTGAPSARANKMAGIHIIKPPQCAYSHRVEIRYLPADEDRDEGWHYRDLDSKSDSESYYHNGPASLLTSQNCMKLLEENITDD